MNFSRKAQGLSLGFIIVAIISIVVLVIIIFAFNKNFKLFNSDLISCASRVGTCKDSCDSDTEVSYFNTDCNDHSRSDGTDGTQVCCKVVLG